MRRCLRFFPIILAAMALAASGPTTILRKAGAQGEVAQLSEAAQRQISALLQEKQSRTAAQKKINSQLLSFAKTRCICVFNNFARLSPNQKFRDQNLILAQRGR